MAVSDQVCEEQGLDLSSRVWLVEGDVDTPDSFRSNRRERCHGRTTVDLYLDVVLLGLAVFSGGESLEIKTEVPVVGVNCAVAEATHQLTVRNVLDECAHSLAVLTHEGCPGDVDL